MVGMEMPPNMGADFCQSFREVFPRVAARNDLPLVPFLLQGVAGIPSLNQGDGIHPNAAGHEIVVETVWKTLAPVLEELTG